MTTDIYMGRSYHASRYNCAHFVLDVWLNETGQDILRLLEGVLCPPKTRKLDIKEARNVEVLPAPISPCIVLMRNRWQSHVGVWLRGRVLHLIEHSGVQYVPLEVAALGFSSVRFFRCRS